VPRDLSAQGQVRSTSQVLGSKMLLDVHSSWHYRHAPPYGYLNIMMKCESLSNRRPQRQWSTRKGVHKLCPLASCQRQKIRVKMREKAPVQVKLVPCACNPAMLGAATEPLHPLAHTLCDTLHTTALSCPCTHAQGQTNPLLLLSNGHTVSQVLGYAICKNH